jgi:hypothetical protein
VLFYLFDFWWTREPWKQGLKEIQTETRRSKGGPLVASQKLRKYSHRDVKSVVEKSGVQRGLGWIQGHHTD